MVEADGTTRDREPAERYALPEVEEAVGRTQPVLLYFYAQEDENDPATRHPLCTKFEGRYFQDAVVAEAAAPYLKIEIDARRVPIPFLGLWKVEKVPALYVLDRQGKIRHRVTGTGASARALAEVLAKIAKQD